MHDLHCFWHATMPVFFCVGAIVDVVISSQKVEKKIEDDIVDVIDR